MGEVVTVLLLQRREVDGTTFYILREGSTCTLDSMKSLKLATLSFLSILVWRMKSERKRALLVAASGKILRTLKLLGKFGAFLLDAGPWPACQKLMVDKGN